MKNITKRDIRIFFFGMFALLLIEVVYDWNATIGAFVDGVKAGYKQEIKKQNNIYEFI